MEYTNIFEPLMLISLSLLVGLLIGSISTLYFIAKDNEIMTNELNKFKKLYFQEVNRWKNKYIDNDPCDRFRDNRFKN